MVNKVFLDDEGVPTIRAIGSQTAGPLRADGEVRRLAVRVTGKVQGVWFRDSARRCAADLHLAGLARNEPGGSVYLEAEGPEPALTQFLAWCHRGPSEARVEAVEHHYLEPVGLGGFKTE